MYDDAGDLARFSADGVFPSGFDGFGWKRRAGITELVFVLIEKDVEGAAVENLEADEMQVDGVGIFSEIHQLPDFGGVEDGFLGDGRVPRGLVEQHAHGLLHLVHLFVEGEAAGLDGLRFGRARDGVEGLRKGEGDDVALCGYADLHDFEAVAEEQEILSGVGAEVDDEVGALGGGE